MEDYDDMPMEEEEAESDYEDEDAKVPEQPPPTSPKPPSVARGEHVVIFQTRDRPTSIHVVLIRPLRSIFLLPSGAVSQPCSRGYRHAHVYSTGTA